MGMFNWKKKDKEPKEITPGLGQIKNIVAIASGKGGVGKSTVTTNMALVLAAKGFTVGVIDADLYGPTQPGLLGNSEVPQSQGGYMLPIDQHGVKFISMGALNPTGGAMVVRAPIAIKAIQQFLTGVLWGELDFLLIDLPPGTGDIQLTLAQQARLSGAIIVTTPQKVAVEIAKKGLLMFQTVNVPILGIVENMSGMVCAKCNEVTNVFGKGGGETLSEDMDVPFLGGVPLDPKIMMSGEEGIPLVLKEAESLAKEAFINLANKLVEGIIACQAKNADIEPEKVKLADGNVDIQWKDGSFSKLSAVDLRLACPCASCIDENTGKPLLDPLSVSLDIIIQGQRPVGRYGLAFNFSDGHNTGIYKLTKMKEMGKVT